MSAKKHPAIQALTEEARGYGRHMAEMLIASHFSDEEKEAWAFLIPAMTQEQLETFDRLLRADMNAQVAHELEDLLIVVRAAQHKRDLTLLALQEEVHQALDAIEKELEAVE